MSTVAVVGAGLTGSLLAVRMAQLGHEVTLLDRRADLRRHDTDAGRSINLAISTRGLDALSHVRLTDRRLDEVVLADAITMPGRMLHDLAGAITFQPYGTDADHVLHSVNRDKLNATLLDAVDATPGVQSLFEQRVRDVDVRTGRLIIEVDGQRRSDTYDVIFGADGAYSAMRGRLQRLGRVDYHQQFLAHGYKELTIAPRPDGGHAMDPHALHIWPRGSQMMIALPNTDGSFTATLFWPFSDADTSFGSIADADTVQQVFTTQYPDAAALMPTLVDDYLANPASSLVTIRTGPWYHQGRLLVVGDAAHAVVPFYGQGANAAMEDVTILMDCYRRLGRDAHAEVFSAFYATRKPDADALADLAIDHYSEMRDTVRSRWFLIVTALGQLLHRLVPARFTPLYTMVSFTRIGYADAVARAEHQDQLVRRALVVVAFLLALALVGVVLYST